MSKRDAQAFSVVHGRLEEVERAFQRGLDDLREELTGHVTSALTAARADYRATRLWGAVFLAVGIGLGTWANLA